MARALLDFPPKGDPSASFRKRLTVLYSSFVCIIVVLTAVGLFIGIELYSQLHRTGVRQQYQREC